VAARRAPHEHRDEAGSAPACARGAKRRSCGVGLRDSGVEAEVLPAALPVARPPLADRCHRDGAARPDTFGWEYEAPAADQTIFSQVIPGRNAHAPRNRFDQAGNRRPSKVLKSAKAHTMVLAILAGVVRSRSDLKPAHVCARPDVVPIARAGKR